MRKQRIKIENFSDIEFKYTISNKLQESRGYIEKKHIRKEKQKEVEEQGFAYCLVWSDVLV